MDIATSSKNLKTLVKALEISGMNDELDKEGPFTIFAPTDKAFSRIGDIDKIIKDKSRLKRIINHHVVSGKIMSKDVGHGSCTETIAHDKICFDMSNGPMVDNASIEQADIKAQNGVVHIIDNVLMPN